MLKTSANKTLFPLLLYALTLSVAFSGSLFFCCLFPQFWRIPFFGMVLLVIGFSLILFWPAYQLIRYFFTTFSNTRAEYFNITLILLITVSLTIGVFRENLSKISYLPDVNLQIALQPDTQSDLSIASPQVVLGTQDLSSSMLIDTGSCEINGEQITFIDQNTCVLSYAVGVRFSENLQITLPHSEIPVHAQITIRHISHTLDLSEIEGGTIQLNETIDPSFSPKKIRYPIWAASHYIWIILLSLGFYALGKTSFYEKSFRYIEEHKTPGNVLITGIFVILAFLYTANRLTSNPFHFPNLYSDAANIASFAAAYANPENFARDPFLADPANYQGYFAFHVPLIRGLGSLTGNYAAAFAFLLFPTILLQLFGYYHLGKHVLNNRLFAFLLSLVTVFSVSLPYFSYEFFGLYGDIIPRVLFQALLPYALVLLSRIVSKPDRWWLGALVFILLFYVHPVSGPNWLIALYLSYMLVMLLQFKRILWKPLLTSLLISVAGLIPFVQAFFLPSQNETVDLALIKEVYAYRLSSQTSSILHLFRYFIKMQITPYATEIFIWGSSLIFLLIAAIYIGKQFLSGKDWDAQNKNHLIPVLLFVWWLATLVSCIGIPLLDEIYTSSTGNLPVLREIRRNIRYLLPLTWITIFWIIQSASIWGKKLQKSAVSFAIQGNLLVFALWLTTAYFYQVKPVSDPVIQQSLSCLQEGKIVCSTSAAIPDKVEFYDQLCSIVQPSQLIFPDPSPAYLGDTLIPRYYCLRSVAYSYKDGGSIGNTTMKFASDWWETTQELEPLLPTPETLLNLDVLDIARRKQADYFIFISPDEQILSQLNPDQMMFQNNYGVIYLISE